MSQKHIPALDGLRGVAILLVLVYHLFNVGIFKGWFRYGWVGVDLFFVLSGYLITSILLKSKGKPNYFRNFYRNRALRILPLYFGVLLIFAFIAPQFTPTKWFVSDQVYFWTFTQGYLILKGQNTDPLFHLWSLAIEEQFYLVWPFIILILRPKQLLLFSAMMLIATITVRFVFYNQYLTFGLTVAHMDGLLIGAVIATATKYYPKYINGRIPNTIGIALLPAAILLYFIPVAALSLTIISLFFGILLLVALKPGMVGNFLSGRFLIFFGKYSYGIYVFHTIISHFVRWGISGKVNENIWLLINVAVLVATIIVSVLSFRYFESLFLRLKVNLYFQEKKPILN
jgi:peptidoglycan/LPS O-acetylase OafA/YrhL